MPSNFHHLAPQDKEAYLLASLHVAASIHRKILRTAARRGAWEILGAAEAAIVHRIDVLKKELGIYSKEQLAELHAKEKTLMAKITKFQFEIGHELYEKLVGKLVGKLQTSPKNLKRNARKRRQGRPK